MEQYETDTAGEESPEAAATDDEGIRAVVERLSRHHPSGGTVIERAAILADGADSTAVVAWIMAHSGKPEVAITSPKRGLHSARLSDPIGTDARPPLRYVLPPE